MKLVKRSPNFRSSVPTGAFWACSTISRTAASASSAFALGTSFVDVQRPAAYFAAVDGVNRTLPFGIVRRLDESESARLPGVPIGDDVNSVDCSMGFEQRAHILLAGTEAQISDKNILH